MTDEHRERIVTLSAAYARADAAYRKANRGVAEHDEKLTQLQQLQCAAARIRTDARDALERFLEELGRGGVE